NTSTISSNAAPSDSNRFNFSKHSITGLLSPGTEVTIPGKSKTTSFRNGFLDRNEKNGREECEGSDLRDRRLGE
ncbi:hypothetical protein A2U01_0098604, partial [Trifolium medium]|nr:hypothetical protein [Trifolium medium]